MAVNTKATTMMNTIVMTIRIAMTAIDMTMMMMMLMLIMMITSLIAVSFRNDFIYSVPYFSNGNNLST